MSVVYYDENFNLLFDARFRNSNYSCNSQFLI